MLLKKNEEMMHEEKPRDEKEQDKLLADEMRRVFQEMGNA